MEYSWRKRSLWLRKLCLFFRNRDERFWKERWWGNVKFSKLLILLLILQFEFEIKGVKGLLYISIFHATCKTFNIKIKIYTIYITINTWRWSTYRWCIDPITWYKMDLNFKAWMNQIRVARSGRNPKDTEWHITINLAQATRIDRIINYTIWDGSRIKGMDHISTK